MIRNNVFNLMNQAVEESKSLWRIKKHYEPASVGNDDMMAIWKKLEKQKEENIAELQALVAKYTNK